MKGVFAFRCRGCGKVYFPKRMICLNCRGREFEEVELGKECRLLTYTELYATPLSIERRPLILGIVEFEDGTRLSGQIKAEKVEIGMKLRPVWDKTRIVGFQELYGFVFEPVA
ncbi:MAG TPA: transcriptional regulator [Candidatus Korarchaeota archaeon]|nr:transcriptional regulator [Candidatus Korarchaeota archaeon]